jgi:four helix bundle protein
MNDETKPTGAQPFMAYEVALDVIRALREVVPVIRRHHPKLADQVVDAASSAAANLAEGNRRAGRDRLHFFRVSSGSTAEVRAHLRVAEAWGWVQARDIALALALIDRELGLVWGLTR